MNAAQMFISKKKYPPNVPHTEENSDYEYTVLDRYM